MTELHATKLLARLRHWMSIDDKHNDALIAYYKVVAPDSYAPIIGESFTSAFIDGAANGYDGGDDVCDDSLAGWLSYIAHDVPCMKGDATVIANGIEYDFKKDDDIIRYLVINH